MQLRLSEAILLGSTLNPKAIGVRHAPDGSSCALGAAEDAIGVRGCGLLESRYPETYNMVAHPIDGESEMLGCVIASLNNGYGLRQCSFMFKPWSRERIASWVATVEPQPQPEPQPEPEPIPEPTEEPVAV